MLYHFIGIKGSGMSGLAQIMNGLGYDVQGSDVETHLFTEDALRDKKITILPFDCENIKTGMTIVKGNAFSEDHVEVIAARNLNLKIYTYQQMIGELTKKYKTIAISGCHGKTTTSALMSHVLNNIKGCNYLIGDGSGYASSKNEYFVLEACEYKRHFLEYFPYYEIITNIELDHIDYYKDLSDVIDAFNEFADKASHMVIACGDDSNVHKLKIKTQVLYYGTELKNDVYAKNINYRNNGTSFDVYIKGNFYGSFDLPLFGNHMLLNALSVITICYCEGIDALTVSKHLKTFKGAKRRFKETFIKDLVLIDDYAHHPTEVAVTIKAAKQKYPNKKIIAVLMTHTSSRTKVMADEFANALSLADYSYVTQIYNDREESKEYANVESNVIIDKLSNAEEISLESVDKLLKYKNSVIIFMSSKVIYKYQKKLEELLMSKNNF